MNYTKEDLRKKIDELNTYRNEYYNNNNSIISDHEDKVQGGGIIMKYSWNDIVYTNDIILEKDMYIKYDWNLTHCLEDIDCSKKYNSTNLSALDAYERQLMRFKIKVSDNDDSSSDNISAFFKNEQTILLLPEYIRRKSNEYITEILSEMVNTDKIKNLNRLSKNEINQGYVKSFLLVETEDKTTKTISTQTITEDLPLQDLTYSMIIKNDMLDCRITGLDSLIETICEYLVRNSADFKRISNFVYSNSIYVDLESLLNDIKCIEENEDFNIEFKISMIYRGYNSYSFRQE